ncbi:MAG: hypothetical protein JW791_00130 [Nanoarchaeota archaeon]|nr:hypothetical protein [Nanoarchaeota archaeon]
MKKKKIIKIFESVLIVLIIVSAIEMISVIASTLLVSYTNMINSEAVLSSKLFTIELFIGIAVAYIYNKSSRK